ncbi:MAG TPA: ABC transporter substrate-binding protein [Methanotrichaceae archaeon]|nr:ABC transporter substrate-binding protein [Methanotrichaceae archaeon]
MKCTYALAFTLLMMLLLSAFADASASEPLKKSEIQTTALPSSDAAIKIAGGFALTGNQSSLDAPAMKGARLAAKEINAAGGVLGRPLDLVVRDSRYNLTKTAEMANQFIEEDRVISGIGFSDTDSVLAAGPIFQKAGIPFITVGASSPKIPDQIGDMIYLACFGDNVQAAAGAEYASRNFGKSAYLLFDRSNEYTVLLAGYFKSSFVELGGNIVLEDSYANDNADISEQISRLKRLPSQPDFYYIAAMPNNVGSVIKQFRDVGLDLPIVGGDGYDTPDLVKTAGRASNGVFFSTHCLMDAEKGDEGIRNFIAAYNREYGYNPENAFAALGYDALRLMADAIGRAGSTDPEAIHKAIQETRDFRGITGNISYLNGTHVPQKGVTIIAVKDESFTLGAELVPKAVPAP